VKKIHEVGLELHSNSWPRIAGALQYASASVTIHTEKPRSTTQVYGCGSAVVYHSHSRCLFSNLSGFDYIMNNKGSCIMYSEAVANAVKTVGSLVTLTPEEFTRVLSMTTDALVVSAEGGLLSRSYKYIFSFKGLTFYCKSRSELMMPGNVQLIQAKKISVPDL
jgi:hypothetical protein